MLDHSCYLVFNYCFVIRRIVASILIITKILLLVLLFVCVTVFWPLCYCEKFSYFLVLECITVVYLTP